MEGAATWMRHSITRFYLCLSTSSAFLGRPVERKDMMQMGAQFYPGGTIAEGISYVIDLYCNLQSGFPGKILHDDELADY